MRRVWSSVVVESGPEPIWRLLSEPERYPDYVTATERLLAASDTTVRVGTTYREYGGIPPFLGESSWEVVAYEPMTHQHHVGDDGKVRMLLDLDVEAVDADRSRLTIGLAIEPRWFMAVPIAIAWPLMMRARAQKVIDDTVANAKHLVEVEQSA